jgi:hypothetical protein
LRLALDFSAQSQVIWPCIDLFNMARYRKNTRTIYDFTSHEEIQCQESELFGGVFWNFVIICHLTQPGLRISQYELSSATRNVRVAPAGGRAFSIGPHTANHGGASVDPAWDSRRYSSGSMTIMRPPQHGHGCEGETGFCYSHQNPTFHEPS